MEPEKHHHLNWITLFSWIAGTLFLAYGMLNFFMDAPVDLRLKPFHASLHALLGCVGLFLPRYRRTFLMTMTVIGLACSIIGFAGVTAVPGLLTLNAPLNYGYAVIGIIGLLLVVSLPAQKNRDAPVIPLQ